MKKLKKALVCLLSGVLVLALMTGCTSSFAYTFRIDNGDSIKISLDTTDKFKISSQVPFTISQDGTDLMHGSFIRGDAYEQCLDIIKSDESNVITDSGVKDGNTYTYWISNGTSYNYVILVNGSNTGVVLENHISEESAKECFNRLTITAEH